MSEVGRAKISEVQKRIASDPEERKRRSDRAKRQHESGTLGKKTWKEDKKVTSRLCKKCKEEFIPEIADKRLYKNRKLTVRTGSKFCLKCRPVHKGGRYLDKNRPASSVISRKCRTCKEDFTPEYVPNGTRSQSMYCLKCRPEHIGGCYIQASKFDFESARLYSK